MAKWETLFKRLMHLEGEADDASEEAADIPFEGFEETLVSTDSQGDADAAQGGTQRAFRFQKDAVQWISAAPSSLRFNNTPLKFADEFRQMREAEGGAWVFTSATLSTAGDFTHFAIETGIPEPKPGRGKVLLTIGSRAAFTCRSCRRPPIPLSMPDGWSMRPGRWSARPKAEHFFSVLHLRPSAKRPRSSGRCSTMQGTHIRFSCRVTCPKRRSLTPSASTATPFWWAP